MAKAIDFLHDHGGIVIMAFFALTFAVWLSVQINVVMPRNCQIDIGDNLLVESNLGRWTVVGSVEDIGDDTLWSHDSCQAKSIWRSIDEKRHKIKNVYR